MAGLIQLGAKRNCHANETSPLKTSVAFVFTRMSVVKPTIDVVNSTTIFNSNTGLLLVASEATQTVSAVQLSTFATVDIGRVVPIVRGMHHIPSISLATDFNLITNVIKVMSTKAPQRISKKTNKVNTQPFVLAK